MFKHTFSVAAIGVASLLTGCSYEKIPAGNVGVKVYLLGSDKGVDSEIKGPGRYWIGINEDLFIFPTFTQTYTWKNNEYFKEAITFQTMEGLSLSAGVGISYTIEPDKVPLIFQKYRKGIDEITNVYIRNIVQNAIVLAASQQPVESVYGKGKAELIAAAEEAVKKQVAPIGIKVEKLYWDGEITLPPKVREAIDAKIQATQVALQRENQVQTAQAQAAIDIAKAKGEAESLRLRSEAEANAIRVKAQALEANPKLVDLNAVDKWDGKLPTNYYSGTPMPFINTATK